MTDYEVVSDIAKLSKLAIIPLDFKTYVKRGDQRFSTYHLYSGVEHIATVFVDMINNIFHILNKSGSTWSESLTAEDGVTNIVEHLIG